jgi:hypothetical protein
LPSRALARRQFIVPAVYLFVALVWTWPLAVHLGNRFTHDPGDPLLVTYLLWWNAHAVPFTQGWWNAPFFRPLPDALALTEHFAGLWPFAAPIQLLGASPLVAYNLILIASIWWSAWGTHALVRRLRGSTAASFCAGLAFAFAPYRTSQMGHLQMYACWWLPLLFLGLHAYMETGRRPWLLMFAAAWLLQTLTNGYFILFLPVVLAAWLLCFTPWRSHARRALSIAVVWALASIPLVPVLLEYRRVQTHLGLFRNRSDMIFYSATWPSFLSATPLLRFWHTPSPATTEVYLFPGVTALALLIVGAGACLRSRAFLFYAIGAVVLALLCLGPAREPLSFAVLWHPYEALARLPGYNGIRVPARFFMIGALFLAVASGLAFEYLAPRVRRGRVLAVLVFAGLFIDGAIDHMPLGIPPGQLGISEPGAQVISLPFEDSYLTLRTMYQAMTHGMPVINGYAGYVPPHAAVIRWALRRQDASVLRELQRGHPLYVIVSSPEEGVLWSRFVSSQPGAELLGVNGGGTVFRLPATPFARPVVPGAPIAASEAADRYAITLSFGSSHAVRVVDIRTRGHFLDLPTRVQIEASTDGVNWTRVFDEGPGGAALAGALAEPREIPLRVVLPDVTARYLRVNVPRLGRGAVTPHQP